MNTAILVKREVKCSELTKELFIKMMLEDLAKSVIENERIFKPIEEKAYLEVIERNKEYIYNRAVKFAESKWKTEKRRLKYIKDEMERYTTNNFIFRPVSYFDFKLNPLDNSISNNCIIHTNADENAIGKCYDEIFENKYFNVALGWKFVDNRKFRPSIKLILPDEYEIMFRNETETLAKTINDFYYNTNYWGD